METDCQRYERVERLLTDGQLDSLTDDDWGFSVSHMEDCQSGRHTVAALEAELGIPIGSLEHGSEEHDIIPASELIERVRALIDSQ